MTSDPIRAIVVPTTPGQTRLFLESPLTLHEELELRAHELAIQTAQMEKVEREETIGKHLFEIYQNGLFRGDRSKGGRSWIQYLKEVTPKLDPEEEGFSDDGARRRIAFYLLRQYALASRGSAAGLVNLQQADAVMGQLPRQGGEVGTGWSRYVVDQEELFEPIRKIWQSACLKASQAKRLDDRPTGAMLSDCRRELVKDPDSGARQLSPEREETLARGRATSSAKRESFPREISQKDLEEARRQAAQREADKRDEVHRPQKVDPRTIDKEGAEIDALAECQKYRHMLIQARTATQALKVFVRSKLNAYGSDYFLGLRQMDAGVWDVSDDVKVVETIQAELLQVHTDITGSYSAGEFDEDFEEEPLG